MQIYVVEQGDNVTAIARRFGVPVQRVIRDNQLGPPYGLAVGQALLIDDGRVADSRPGLESRGYAYPYMDPQVLQDTLPYLTALPVFSYHFSPQGDLMPPPVDDLWMVQEARQRGVRPMLVLTPIDPEGRFNNQLASALFRNLNLQEKLIGQLWQTLRLKGYEGVDLDFEYVLPEDRENYPAFARRLRAVLSPFGYQVSVALAPKTSRYQQGLLYEGIDYGLLGAAADKAFLMTYEWGYTYSQPMPVAPVHRVRQVVEYALTEIPREKIIMGIPNYGYDWPLPFQQGVTRAKVLGNVEAVQVALGQGARIQFDPIAQTPHYQYRQSGVLHEVWFEDVRSLLAKFQLIKEFQLAGAGYWQVMRWFLANWLLLDNEFMLQKTL